LAPGKKIASCGSHSSVELFGQRQALMKRACAPLLR
jgi:hypothetical protein